MIMILLSIMQKVILQLYVKKAEYNRAITVECKDDNKSYYKSDVVG